MLTFFYNGTSSLFSARSSEILTFDSMDAILTKLNLPEYIHRIELRDGRRVIFDRLRKKFVTLTPEEWVRQNFIGYLIHEKGYPEPLIAVESGLKVGRRRKRTDVMVYSRNGAPLLIVECKAPEVALDTKVFDQIVRYNIPLQVRFLIITNGLIHYCCELDYPKGQYRFLQDIPDYSHLI